MNLVSGGHKRLQPLFFVFHPGLLLLLPTMPEARPIKVVQEELLMPQQALFLLWASGRFQQQLLHQLGQAQSTDFVAAVLNYDDDARLTMPSSSSAKFNPSSHYVTISGVERYTSLVSEDSCSQTATAAVAASKKRASKQSNKACTLQRRQRLYI